MSATHSTKARRKRLAAVYREAASLIENGSQFYACDAIGKVIGTCSDRAEEVGRFADYFEQPWSDCVGGWWDSRDYFEWREDNAFFPSQTPRVIALLLMAELAMDGQLD